MNANLMFLFNRTLRLNDENGQTLVEYALILLLLVIAVAVTIPGVATALIPKYTLIAVALSP